MFYILLGKKYRKKPCMYIVITNYRRSRIIRLKPFQFTLIRFVGSRGRVVFKVTTSLPHSVIYSLRGSRNKFRGELLHFVTLDLSFVLIKGQGSLQCNYVNSYRKKKGWYLRPECHCFLGILILIIRYSFLWNLLICVLHSFLFSVVSASVDPVKRKFRHN